MVARLEEVAQLLRRRGTVGRARRPGGVPAVEVAGMRKDFPRWVGSLRRLVDDTTARGMDAGWADTKGLKTTPRWRGYGRYLRLARAARAQVWFGIDFGVWVQQSPPTPLWLWFTSNSLLRREQTRGALEPLRGKNPSELIDDGAGGLYVPVTPKSGH